MWMECPVFSKDVWTPFAIGVFVLTFVKYEQTLKKNEVYHSIFQETPEILRYSKETDKIDFLFEMSKCNIFICDNMNVDLFFYRRLAINEGTTLSEQIECFQSSLCLPCQQKSQGNTNSIYMWRMVPV